MSVRPWSVVLVAVGVGLGGCGGEDAPTGASCDEPRLLVTTSDFSTGGLGWIGADGTVRAAASPLADQDTAPAWDGCRAMLLERGLGRVAIQREDHPLVTARTIDVNPDGATPPYAANPQQVLRVAPDRAYVSRLAVSSLAVIDPREDGADGVLATIDLSSLGGAMDQDSVDASAMTQVDGRVYVGLGRYDFDEMFAIHFDDGSILAVLDPATDGIVGSIVLEGDNPTAILHDAARERLLVHAHGDFFTTDGGIETVDLASGTSSGMLVTEVDAGGEIDAIVLAGADAAWLLVGGAALRRLDLATGDLGPPIEVPGASAIAIAGDTLYVAARPMTGDPGIHAFGADDGAVRTPAAGPWRIGTLPPYQLAGTP